MTSLSISSKISDSIYINKQSFNHSSPIFLRNLRLTIFIVQKALSTLAVTIGKVNVSFIGLYTSGYMLSFFFSTIFYASLLIPFTDMTSTFDLISIKYVVSCSEASEAYLVRNHRIKLSKGH